MRRPVTRFLIPAMTATAIALTVLGVGASQSPAAIVSAAPMWPIPADAPAGPPAIPALPAATDAPPPVDQIADPVTPAAACGGWYQQGNYADRWPAASTWWEYRCTYEDSYYYTTCTGGGACEAFCWYCYWETQDRTDYFYWDGSNAIFYGEAYSDSVVSEGDLFPPYWAADWWDVPTAQWYVLGPHSLTVSKTGSGSGEVYSSPNGIYCGDTCQASFGDVQAVTLTAFADPSSIFTGWSGDCSGADSCQVTMDEAHSVTATFARKTSDLTVSKAGTGSGQVISSPAGIACGDSCQASFDAGTTVTLTASADAGSLFTGWSGDCSGTGSCQVTFDQARSVTATFALNAPPHASFTVECIGLSCTFDGSASSDGDGTVASYGWAFGEGASGTGVTATHTFAHSGTYLASLIVTDDRGASATVSKDVTVTNLAPTAAFTVTCSGLRCTLDASGSADRDGTIASYGWSFGDGTSGSVTTTSTVHDYAKAGSYTLTLTVTDNDRASASSSRRINPISLSARGYKQGGHQKVDLSWNGVSGTSFDVFRNGVKIVTVSTTGYTDTAVNGPGTYKYAVCDTASGACSNEATASF
jgi:PKD repeat protein